MQLLFFLFKMGRLGEVLMAQLVKWFVSGLIEIRGENLSEVMGRGEL